MNIIDVVENFNTTPFLFLGSGITRRYYNLPDWKGLLEYFAKQIINDDFAYSQYENRASKELCRVGLLPKVAELIQMDYDEAWFKNPCIRKVDEEFLNKIKNGLSPFKAEVAEYIIKNSKEVEIYQEEIDMLSNLAKNNLAGVITTNYDCFVEKHFEGYTKYVGQKQLIFSAIQGIAEIYKIHGTVEEPESLIINEKDYLDFDQNSEYLVAKLMTIFMEYPIIFMGYSINDSNIQKIIKSIVNCLDSYQLDILTNRFVFVEYQQGKVGAEVTPYTVMIDEKSLTMTKIVVDDFKIIYKALECKKAKLPVRILRRFKQELYNFTVTNKTTSNLKVAAIEDERVSDEELVMAIGKYSDFGLKGLNGLEADEWYRSIILNDLDVAADDLLEYAAPKLLRQNSGRLPLNKYLSAANGEFEKIRGEAKKQNFDALISNTIKRNRHCVEDYHSVKQVWDNEKQSIDKATRLIAYLPEAQIDVIELEQVLNEIFMEDVNILQNPKPSIRTNIRRLIAIYDYLKWGKKELHD